MGKVIILYNPLSGSGQGKQDAQKLKEKGELVDITKIRDYKEFFSGIDIKDEVIIAGGDGTISRFANDTHDMEIKNPLYYYATGTGNDFWQDMNLKKGDEPFLVNRIIDNLPLVTINGKDYRFINAVGFGIDGYACEVADSLRDAGKKINYISIVIKGILYAFKPRKATITVDGKVYKYDKVWFAPVMKGRFYGGGIKMAPLQDRQSGKVTAVVIHTATNLRLLPLLPTAFKGEHLKYTKYVTLYEGENITVEFDRPTALQVDGETFKGITKYTVSCKNYNKMENELIS